MTTQTLFIYPRLFLDKLYQFTKIKGIRILIARNV